MPDAPKPVTSYIVVNRDWDPSEALTSPTNGPLPPRTLGEAKAQKAGYAAMTPREPCNKVIYKAVVTYTRVEGGDDA